MRLMAESRERKARGDFATCAVPMLAALRPARHGRSPGCSSGSAPSSSSRVEDHAMSLVRDSMPTGRGFLGVLFSVLLALAPFGVGAVTAQELKQIKLTEKQIQSFMAAYEDMAKVYDDANADKPDPKVEAEAAAVAKKNGFASLAQYDEVLTNITMIMSGIDPQTKKFTEPPEQIKRGIAALRADKS